jgi:hypothetical protein
MLGITFSSAVVDHKQSNNMQLHKYHELHAELTITNWNPRWNNWSKFSLFEFKWREWN